MKDLLEVLYIHLHSSFIIVQMDPENPSAEEQMTDDEDGDGFRVLKERRVPAGQPFNGDDEEDDEDEEGEEDEVRGCSTWIL